MARLTEEMVVARTKQSDMAQVTKLNCWGSELADVRLLRRMQNVEVLSLSVNKIRSLEDFQYCRNLVELFVRKNDIGDLSQILYLQNLPKLRNLWLEENPCAQEDEYRFTVLRALPNLKTLDKIPVEPEEVQDALRRGRELIHPEAASVDEYWEQSDSRDCSPPPAYQRTEQQQPQPQPQTSQQQPQSPTLQEKPQPLQPESPRSSIVQDPVWPEDSQTAEETSLQATNTPPRRFSSSQSLSTQPAVKSSTVSPQVQASHPQSHQSHLNDSSPVGQRAHPHLKQRSPPRCPVDTPSATFTRKPSRDYITRNADDVPVGGGVQSGQYYHDDPEQLYQRQTQALPQQPQHVYEDPQVEDEPSVVLRQPPRVSNGSYHDPHMNQGDNSSSDGSGGMYRERSRPVSTVEDDSRQNYERNNRQTHERLSSAAQRLANDRFTCTTNQRAPYPRRPITRSSNLLSAVLCLVKELDYPSLEVVEMAVKCRMDELED